MNSANQKHAAAAATKQSRAADRESLARRAARRLSRVCPRMKRLIAKVGPHRPIVTADPFAALVGSIVQQQISMSAAAAVQKRFKALCPRGRVTPAAVGALSEAELRGAGLSRQKTRYVLSLAEHFSNGELSTRKLRRMSDEDVIEATTKVIGVGRWTAEMLLIFCLERPDIWPIDDLGLRKAVRDFEDLADLPDAKMMRDFGQRWRPWRTYASWYLWRSLEGPLMPGIEIG